MIQTAGCSDRFRNVCVCATTINEKGGCGLKERKEGGMGGFGEGNGKREIKQ